VEVSSVGTSPESASRILPPRDPSDFFEVRLALFEKRIAKIARRYARGSLNHDDLVQAGRVAFWNAWRAYDRRREHLFEHYASRSVARAIRREARKEQYHWSGRVDLTPDPHDAGGWIETLESQTPRESPAFEDPAYWQTLLSHIGTRVPQLPMRVRRVFELRYVQGQTQPDVARILNVSQQRVSQLERQLSRVLAEAS